MDNAAFHNSVLVKNALRERNVPHKFPVPYSPELNPIDEFFSMLKSKFKHLKQQKGTWVLKIVFLGFLNLEMCIQNSAMGSIGIWGHGSTEPEEEIGI